MIGSINLTFQIHDLPKPSYLNKTIQELEIGSYSNIEVASIIVFSFTKFR